MALNDKDNYYIYINFPKKLKLSYNKDIKFDKE